MLDCNHFEELCSASLDVALTRAQKRELETHLKLCPACAAYIEDLKALRAAWGDLKEPLPDALHEGIMRGILAEAEKKAKPAQKGRRITPMFTMIAAAAACVMLVMSGAIGNLIGGLKIAAPAGGGAAAGSGMSDAVMHSFEAASSAQNDQASSEEAPASARIAPPLDTGEAKQGGGKLRDVTGDASQENAGEATPFTQSAAADARTQTENAADGLSVTLPNALQANRFGFCYVAVGSGDPPVLKQASLIEKDGSIYYFRIENNMSSLEKLRAQLQEAGYETALRADIGIATDEDAADSLLILSLEQ